MFTKKVSLLALALVTTILMGLSVFGQATTGTLRGTVVDSKGDVVAGAAVKVKNEATGVENTATTDSEGGYSVAQLIPGPYSVSVEQSGFKRSVKTGVQVSIGQTTSANLSLEVGAPSETVTVVASGDETLQTEQAQVSGTIDTRRVEELPSNGAGNGIDTLALLIPGVVNTRASGTNTNGTGLSVNGNRGRSNNFQIDGEDNNDLSVGGPALFVDFQDSVQEFQVVTNNFGAQYGRNQGAIVNIVTKTGTNDFHGTAFLFHRDRFNLDSLTNTARRACNPAAPTATCFPPRDLYNVFGGTFGGPILAPNFGENDGPIVHTLKNRAFFFFGYQGVREPSSTVVRTTSQSILPSQFNRLRTTYPNNPAINTLIDYNPFNLGSVINTTSTAGQATNFTSFQFVGPGALGARLAGCPLTITVGAPIPNSTAPGNPTCAPAGFPYVTPIDPATGQPFRTGGPYDVYNFGTAAAPDLYQAAQYEHPYDTTYFENYWQWRFDLRPTNKDNVSFRYINQFSSARCGAVCGSNGWHGDVPASSKNLGGDWTRQISSRLVNTVRMSRQQIGVEFGGGCQTRTPGCVPGPADIDQAFASVAYSIPGVTKTGSALPTIGVPSGFPQGRVGTVKQLADTVNWSSGTHSWMFGYEYKKLFNLVPFLPSYQGVYTFNAASRVVNNAPSALTIAIGDPLLPFGETDNYAFVQDDWKIKPNLTLNLGVRYENTGQPVNVLHDATVARESSSKPLFNPALPLSVRTVAKYPTDNNNFAPRVGFAWVPKFWKSFLGEDATVIRGGYSIAYEPTFYNILLNIANGAPFSAALAVPGASLTNTPGLPFALPQDPYGDTVRANAANKGFLLTGVLDPRYLAIQDLDPNFYSPYSQQFSLGVQHQFGRKVIAEARYVGTKGTGLFQNINSNFSIGNILHGFALNRAANGTVTPRADNVCLAGQTCILYPSLASQVPAGTTAQVCVDNGATADNEAACNDRLRRQSSTTTRTNSASSIYHSLQTRVNGRLLGDSLTWGASYTWSKSIDNASEIFSFTGDGSNSPNPQNPFCQNSCERGLSSFDRRHAFTTNFIYDVPFMKEQRGILGHILGGWQVNAVYYLTSGQRYTPQNAGTASNFGLAGSYLTVGDRPFAGNPNAPAGTAAIAQVDAFMLFGFACNPSPCTASNTGFWSLNAINEPVTRFVAVTPNDVRFIANGPQSAKIFGTPFGSLGRYTEVGPIFNQLNLSVFKNIRIAERFRMQLRGEAFNFLNHPNPGIGSAVTGGTAAVPSTSLLNAGFAGSAFHDDKDISLARRVVQVAVRLIF